MVNLPFVGQPEWGEQLNHAIEELDSTVNEGRLSPASLSTTIGTELGQQVPTAVAHAIAEDPRVVEEAAPRAATVSAAPVVAEVMASRGVTPPNLYYAAGVENLAISASTGA